MQAVVATYGTTGDVQPLLGLATGLSRRGHSVRIAAPPDFGPRMRGLGLEFVPLGPPIDSRLWREVYGRASLSADAVEHVRRTLPLSIAAAPQMITELASTCLGADVLIALPYQLAGRIVHELQKIPLISVHLSPFGGYGRRFAAESSRLINELRACYGLGPLRDPLGLDGSSSLLAIYAVSTEIFLRPRRWPEHHRMTGFFFFDEPWIPDPNLARFIDSGDPPIVISFGSVLHESPEDLAKIVSDAIRIVGKRAVVQRGWTELKFDSLLDDVLLVDFVPHHWLFPKAACVLHAGGAGTTAATLRAGVPSVVVPHVLDQFIWAALLKERGCASDVIPYLQLTSERLGSAIERACESDCRRAATELCHRISLENGVATAVDLIESFVETRSP